MIKLQNQIALKRNQRSCQELKKPTPEYGQTNKQKTSKRQKGNLNFIFLISLMNNICIRFLSPSLYLLVRVLV